MSGPNSGNDLVETGTEAASTSGTPSTTYVGSPGMATALSLVGAPDHADPAARPRTIDRADARGPGPEHPFHSGLRLRSSRDGAVSPCLV
jgi:hypothetical protein